MTDVQWLPGATRPGVPANDVFAAACSDGTFKIIARGGRLEKSVEAHRGATTAVRWNGDGTAILTVGEDGAVKTWSRAGLLRATLEQREAAVYCRRVVVPRGRPRRSTGAAKTSTSNPSRPEVRRSSGRRTTGWYWRAIGPR